MTTRSTAARPVESAVTTITTPTMVVTISATDPMQILSDLGCENERIIAAFEMFAANLKELADFETIKPRDLYEPWMVLAVLIDAYRDADMRLGAVESALLKRLTHEQREALKREG